ncbi:MAG: radical SAM protein [Ruminococcaceae bacterium]|nr:radical SAM protein [Oscillospiraceae bacterium]
MKKVLMIQPPQWYPITPHLAVPLLSAQLKRAGFSVDIIDLNVKFFNRILTSHSLACADNKAKADLLRLAKLHQNTDFEAVKNSDSYAQKASALKYLSLKKFYEEHGAEIPALIANIDEAVRTMKEAELFYMPEALPAAKHNIRLALRLASMPFAPNEIDLDNYFVNPLLNLDWKNIKAQVADRSVNMFYDYMLAYAKEFAKASYDVICLSLTDLSQLISVFTLSRFLKERTNATIILGGNYATQISKDIIQFEEIFKEYIDFVSIGNGEVALPALCKALAEGISPEKLPNAIFYSRQKGKVINTGFSCAPFSMDDLVYPDFSGYDFRDYFTPEPIFPVELSKGCYWGKCTFCDYAYGQQQYSPKAIPRIIDELRYLVDTYGASKFIFVDECIPPLFYNRLATAIIEAGLKIHFYSFARLENAFTKEVLQNLYNAGARLFLWGYECESLRVMKLMNKGIDAENRLKILTDARDVGIWNNGLFIFGYPTETLEEIRQTMDVIMHNRRVICSCTFSNFALKKHSKLVEDIGKNGVFEYAPNGEFYTVYKDKIDGIEQLQRRALRRNFQFDFLEKNAHALWSVVFSDFDHLLLYLAKYGCDYVSEYRSEHRVAPEFR